MGKKRSKNLAKNVRLLEQAMEDVETVIWEKSDERKELAQQIKSLRGGKRKKSLLKADSEKRKGFERRPPGWDLPLPEMEENPIE